MATVTEHRRRSRTGARPSSLHPRLRAVGSRTLLWIPLVVWGLFCVVPIAWLLLAVTKSSAQLVALNPFALGSLSNVADAWAGLIAYSGGIVFRWLGNTLVLTVSTIIATIIITIPAGYALGSTNFRMRRPLLAISIGLMLLPSSSLVLPLFLEMSALGLIGNPLAVILPSALFPFGLLLTFIYFSTAVDRDFYDAARMDGCTEIGVFTRIALPLAKPMIILVAFYGFMRSWNDFVLPFVMLGSDGYPLQVGLATLASVSPDLNPSANPISGVGAPQVLMATIIAMAPALVGILVAQRSILRSADLLGGGLRG